MQKLDTPVFSPEVPPDLEHASQIREEAFDWLESHYPGDVSFTTGNVLRMAGESSRRWLIARLRARGIGNEELFAKPATADALTVLFLRSRGVKFREAVDAIVGRDTASGSAEPRYGGVWTRLVVAALDRLRRRVPPRLLGSAVFSLLPDQKDQPNCLLVVKRHGRGVELHGSNKASPVGHDYVYKTILERPAPSCSVVAPSLEVLFFGNDQLPARSEVTSRHFVGIQVATERETYEILVGTMKPASVALDGVGSRFVGRILDIVFLDFESFHRSLSSSRFDTAIEPEPGAAGDLQLWSITQFLDTIYSGALCEVIETSPGWDRAKALASSAAKPWEPSRWDPPTSLEMLSGYASRVGVPLVVPAVEPPWSSVIRSVEPEMRYLRGRASDGEGPEGYSALALPFVSNSGDLTGSLYLLMPQIEGPRLEVEVRILMVFSRVIGEIIERQRTATHSASVYADIATLNILNREQFKAALLGLLSRKAGEIGESGLQRDMRLPFLLLSAHRPDPDEFDPAVSDSLKNWLVGSLRHLEWRSFAKSHLSAATGDSGIEGFIGELPGVGMVIALDKLVTKDELDNIRNAFPTTINRTSPSNAPVKLLAYVLDVPAQRISDAADSQGLEDLADEVERWAFDVAAVVDDVAHSFSLAHEQGEWEAALRKVRKALQKEGSKTNAYLYRIAADCSFSLGDWPGALKYAGQAATLSRQELGSGLVRSLCLEGDAHLCLCDPVRAWDLYSEAGSRAPNHPLPRYYRGQALLLIGRLLQVFEDEQRRASVLDAAEAEHIGMLLNTLVNGAMDDLTLAADLLERWGLIPESYQYRNFHLIPTLIGQGVGYLLTRLPGPAASRIQSARRSFPKDDLFFREYIFAKCWEQGLHRDYGALLLSDQWAPLAERLHQEFGEPPRHAL